MIVRYLIAAACLLFVVSLPVARTQFGGTLRRCAAVCFLAALAPSVFFGLIGLPTTEHLSPITPGLGRPLVIFGLILLSVLSYAGLEIWKRLHRPRNDAWTEYVNQRSSGKTVIQERDRRRAFSEIGTREQDDEEGF